MNVQMKTRLVQAIAGVGAPIDTLELIGSPPSGAIATYMVKKENQSDVDYQNDIDRGKAVIAGWDWSGADYVSWADTNNLELAKRCITSREPVPLAARAGMVALMLSLQEARAKINELILAAQAGDVSNVALLVTGDSIEQGFGVVAELIDARMV